MTTFLQLITAFFAVVGVFETAWQLTLLFCRKAVKETTMQILITTNEHSDPAFLAEDLRILSNHLVTQNPLRIWLICPKGAPQEAVCRYLAQQNESVRIVTPEKLSDEVRAFAENL